MCDDLSEVNRDDLLHTSQFARAARGFARAVVTCAVSGISLALFQAASMRRHSSTANVISHRFILGALAALLFTANASAAVQAPEAIQAAAEEFVRASLPESAAKHFVTASRLDSRLRLDECAAPL